jgi:hypothetical protein
MALLGFLVGVKGLEPSTSASRTLRATNCATPRESTGYTLNFVVTHSWYPRRESNPHLTLRTGLLYPLSYEGKLCHILPYTEEGCSWHPSIFIAIQEKVGIILLFLFFFLRNPTSYRWTACSFVVGIDFLWLKPKAYFLLSFVHISGSMDYVW